MFGGGTNTEYDDIVAKTTDENLTGENWELILNLCDKVADEGQTGAHSVIAAILKRLAHRNPNVQLYALSLAESLSKNLGIEIRREIASRAFTQGLEKLITDRNTHDKVRKRALGLIGVWTEEFEGDTSLGIMEDCYNNLKAKNYKFDQLNEAPPPAVDDEIRRKEEEELQRVLAMSMQDKGGRDRWAQYTLAGSSGAGGSGSSSSTAGKASTSGAGSSSSHSFAQPKYQAGYVPARTPSPVPQSPPPQAQPPTKHQSHTQPQSHTYSAQYSSVASSSAPSLPTSSTPISTSTAAPASAAPATTNSPAPMASNNIVTRVRALFTFEPTEAGELAFEKGEIIKVVDRGYKDWWRGQLKGRTGIFPVNYVEPLPEPTAAELAREAEQEAAVFSQAANVEKLLSSLRALDPAKDNLADNEEIQELYRSCMALRPKIVKLIDKYSQKRADLVSMNETFVRARTIFDRMMEESLARHTGLYDQPAYRPGPQPYHQGPRPDSRVGPQAFGWNPAVFEQPGYNAFPAPAAAYPAQPPAVAQPPQGPAPASYGPIAGQSQQGPPAHTPYGGDNPYTRQPSQPPQQQQPPQQAPGGYYGTQGPQPPQQTPQQPPIQAQPYVQNLTPQPFAAQPVQQQPPAQNQLNQQPPASAPQAQPSFQAQPPSFQNQPLFQAQPQTAQQQPPGQPQPTTGFQAQPASFAGSQQEQPNVIPPQPSQPQPVQPANTNVGAQQPPAQYSQPHSHFQSQPSQPTQNDLLSTPSPYESSPAGGTGPAANPQTQLQPQLGSSSQTQPQHLGSSLSMQPLGSQSQPATQTFVAQPQEQPHVQSFGPQAQAQTQPPIQPQTEPQVQPTVQTNTQLQTQPQILPQTQTQTQLPQNQTQLQPQDAPSAATSAAATTASPIPEQPISGPPPYVYNPRATYADPNVQAWAQYYAQGGRDLTGAVYFLSVPGVTDGTGGSGPGSQSHAASTAGQTQGQTQGQGGSTQDTNGGAGTGLGRAQSYQAQTQPAQGQGFQSQPQNGGAEDVNALGGQFRGVQLHDGPSPSSGAGAAPATSSSSTSFGGTAPLHLGAKRNSGGTWAGAASGPGAGATGGSTSPSFGASTPSWVLPKKNAGSPGGAGRFSPSGGQRSAYDNTDELR